MSKARSKTDVRRVKALVDQFEAECDKVGPQPKRRKTRRVWLCRDVSHGWRRPYHVYDGFKDNISTCVRGGWCRANMNIGVWLGEPDMTAAEMRRHFDYHGPLPKPGKRLRVTVEVPT